MVIKSFEDTVPQITYLIKKKLWAQVLLGLFLGLIVGIFLGPESGIVEKETAEIITSWISIPAHLFLKIIQMIIVPLIFASIIRGLTAAGGMKQLQTLGLGVAVYFVVTTAIAIAIGIFVATTINPGNFIDSSAIRESFGIEELSQPIEKMELSIYDIPQNIVGLVPSNPLASFMSGEMLSIIIFAIIIGVSVISLPKKSSQPILDLLESVQNITMKVVSWAMRLAPFAAFGLIADITSKVGLESLAGLGVYMLTVIIGLFAMMVVYLIIIKFFAKRPLSIFGMMKDSQLLAFSTSSSAAVMPVSLKAVEEKMKVKPEVSQFVIPLGATINMNGTALYQIVAVFFLAEIFATDLGITTILLISVTALAASIGAPSAPGTGIVILSTILIAAGIPPVGILLILGVDRLLDMTRTMVNVTGDMTACLFFDKRMRLEK
jgi:Na+/H+-dicarboxylate symporter